jgi:hypothetical protein
VERRKAIGFATALTLVGSTSAFAVGANFGLFGLAAAEGDKGPALPVRTERAAAAAPIAPATVEEVQVIDVPVAATPTSVEPISPAAPPVQPAAAAAASPETETDEGRFEPKSPPTSQPHTDDHVEHEDGVEQEPCEVHDDGLVECHDHEDD